MGGRPPNEDTQVKRFREAARKLGADKSEAAFDRALRKVASAPPAPKHKADKSKQGSKKKAG